MYAKHYFQTTQLIPDSGLCFVLMPFDKDFDEVWETVRGTVEEPPFNLLCRRADDISLPGQVMTDVLENIGRARLLIADLTGQNANVFYELGIAHTVKEPSQVILIADEIEAIPFDLRHLRCIQHRRDLGLLRARLAEALRALGVRQYRLSLGAGERGAFPLLSGDDRCLYAAEILVEHVGEDGVKFGLKVMRHEVGVAPAEFSNEGYYLGVDQPAVSVPGLPWSLCWAQEGDGRVRFILGGR